MSFEAELAELVCEVRCRPAVIDRCRFFHRLMSNVACHLFNAACWAPRFYSSHSGSVSPVQFSSLALGLQASQSCESPCVGGPMLEHVQMCRKLMIAHVYLFFVSDGDCWSSNCLLLSSSVSENLAWTRCVAMHFFVHASQHPKATSLHWNASYLVGCSSLLCELGSNDNWRLPHSHMRSTSWAEGCCSIDSFYSATGRLTRPLCWIQTLSASHPC